MKKLVPSIVLMLALICLTASSFAGIKGGTLKIDKVTPYLADDLIYSDVYSRGSSVVERFSFKDDRKFLVLFIELSVDWTGYDTANEHTIMRKTIGLKTDEASLQKPLGQYSIGGYFAKWFPSYIHLQRDEENKYFMDLVFPIKPGTFKTTLSISDIDHQIEIPKAVQSVPCGIPANFEIASAKLIDSVPGGDLPRPVADFKSIIKPRSGKILELTLKIQPLESNSSGAGGGAYQKRMFSVGVSDIGIVTGGGLNLKAFAAPFDDRAMRNMNTSSSLYEGKWIDLTLTTYIHVPDNLTTFKVTYRNSVVAQGQVPTSE